MRTTWAAALVVVAGCGSSEPGRIVIEGAPHLYVPEGTTHIARVTVEPPPPVPLSASDLTLRLGDGEDAVFDQAELTTRDGVLSLALQPRCDAVPPDGPDAIVTLDVTGAADTGLVAADAIVQIPASAGSACAPRVVAWTGDCAVAPATAGAAVTVPAGATTLCLWPENRDPTNERMWVRTQSDAPGTLLAAASLPSIDDVAAPSPVAVPLANTADIRGVFRIEYQVYRADPASLVMPASSGTISITVGEPGTSIEVVGEPSSTPEFSVGDIEFNVWHLADVIGTDDTCARVTLVDPTPGVAARTDAIRSKATARLYGAAGAMAEVDTWLCGTSFRMAYSPPVDSRPTETVRVEAATCTCGAMPSPLSSVVTYDAVIPVQSMAETLACDAAFSPSDAVEIVCADLDDDGDTTPEVVLRTKDTMCVFGGNAGRHVTLSSESVAANAGQSRLHALVRNTVAGPATLVLATERVPPTTNRVVQLSVPAAPGQPPTWVAFPPFADATAPLTHLAAFAPTSARAATYAGYVVPVGPALGIRLRCIDEAACCTGPGVCDQVEVGISDFGAQERMAGLAAADLDGDGIDEVVMFTLDDASGTTRLHARIIPVTWTADAPAFSAGPFARIGGQVASGTGVRVAVQTPQCAVPPCAESVFAVATGSTNAALMFRLMGGTTTTLNAIQTPSIAFDVASTGSTLVAGLDFGLFEGLVAGNLGVVAWMMQDPVLLESTVAGVIRSPAPGYGSRVARCLGTDDESSVVVAATPGSARYTRLSLDVSEP